MKFNVGDKVLEKNHLELLFNPYHKKRYRESLIKTVTEANEDYFSIHKPSSGYETAIEQGFSAGMNEHMIYRQSSGNCFSWSSKTRLFHLLEDKEEITSIIKTIGEENFNKDEEFILDQIELLKNDLTNKRKTFEGDLLVNLGIINA